MTKDKPTGGNCKGTIVKQNGLLHAKTTCMIDAKLYGRMGGKPKVAGEKAKATVSTVGYSDKALIESLNLAKVDIPVAKSKCGKYKKDEKKDCFKLIQAEGRDERKAARESEGKSGYSAEGREVPKDIYA